MTADLIEYADTPNAELARKGLMDGFKEVGLEPNKDFDLRRQSAQGDMATLSSIIDAALTRRTDLMITMSTPSLQNALLRAKGTPIVFGLVSNPFIVQAGKTDADHLPYVTGSYLDQPVNELLAVVRQVLPKARRIGTLFTPAEINSVWCKEQLEAAAKKAGLEFEAVAINSSTEVTESAATIAGRKLDALTQVTDNLIASSFPAVMEAARRARLPVLTYAPAVADMGPLAIVARDYYDNGVETAKIAARVMRGERTADIPFSAVPKINYIVNLKVAADYQLQVPQELIAKAIRVIR